MTRACWTDALMIGAVTIMAALSGDARGAQDTSAALTPAALAEIARVEAEIDRIEAQTLTRLAAPPDNQVQQIELLGKLMLYDKDLSVNRNEACAFWHMPETGFTGPVSELNRTTGSYPGSVRTRFSNRKPQSHAYAPLSPVLHYNPGQGDLVGGNFWDMRATGRRLGNPAAEQAEGPPTNPVEMGLPDNACAVSRASQRPYRTLFERVWGAQASPMQRPSALGIQGYARFSFTEITGAAASFGRDRRSIARWRTVTASLRSFTDIASISISSFNPALSSWIKSRLSPRLWKRSMTL